MQPLATWLLEHDSSFVRREPLIFSSVQQSIGLHKNEKQSMIISMQREYMIKWKNGYRRNMPHIYDFSWALLTNISSQRGHCAHIEWTVPCRSRFSELFGLININGINPKGVFEVLHKEIISPPPNPTPWRLMTHEGCVLGAPVQLSTALPISLLSIPLVYTLGQG